MMSEAELKEMFTPVLDDIVERSQVVDAFLDRNLYRIYIATLFANVVLEPEDVGITEDDLETVHDLISQAVRRALGQDEDLTTCFRFINTKAGELAMQEARLTQNHKDLLLYFSSMILDPDGHRRWMDLVREDKLR